MDEDKNKIKIVPAKKISIPNPTSQKGIFLFVLVFLSFIGLITLLSFLPMTSALRFTSLLVGSFLIIDLHRTLKVRYYDTGNY
jgi:hypothetical protein